MATNVLTRPKGDKGLFVAVDPIERFFKRVDKNTATGCWLWTGAISNEYGSFYPQGATNIKAHRYSYQIHRGDIPVGKFIDHLCSNKLCVNPNHLEVVTKSENGYRAWQRGEQPKRAMKSHCVNGHPLTLDNVRRYNNRNCCITCRRVSGRKSDAKRRSLQ